MSELPKGWSRTKLANVGKWCSGGTPSRRNPNYFGQGIPWIKSGDLPDGPILNVEEQITQLGLNNSAAKVLPTGTISIALYGATIGKLGILTFPAATNQACANVVSDSNLIEQKYLFFYLMSQKKNLIEMGQGGAQPNISQEILKSYPIVLAPLNEQRRIVAKLEKLLSRVDAAQARLAKIPMILKRFRQSVLSAATSGKLTADWRLENPNIKSASKLLEDILDSRRLHWEETQSEVMRRAGKVQKGENWKRKYAEPNVANSEQLEDLPEHWVWATWNQISNWVTYGFTRPMPHVLQGVPIVTAKHIVKRKILFEETDKTTKQAYLELSNKDRPESGDILITKDGSIGRAALITTSHDFCINQSVAVAWLRSQTLDKKYLLAIVESPFTQNRIKEKARGAAIQHLSITDFAKIPVPVPPMAEQQVISCRIETLFETADLLEARYMRAKVMVEKLSQSILARAFRGEIVSQDSKDEPASLLLKDIQSRSNLSRDKMVHPHFKEISKEKPVRRFQ